MHRHFARLFTTRSWSCVLLLGLLLAVFHGPAFGTEEAKEPTEASASPEERQEVSPAPDFGEFSSLLDRHKVQLSREMAQIRREIAALRDDMARPGIKEVFAGVGYILGLAGVAFYMHARRERLSLRKKSDSTIDGNPS
ncbi:MAG: hypothetical protein GX443_16485 [Deltaproteobacteria bacterium]|nr:hypothetical protein [Deltaproteobacteria bacterium]